MSQAIQCNRCKEFAALPNDGMDMMVNNGQRIIPRGWFRQIIMSVPEEVNLMPYRMEHDICPNCKESYEEWALGNN
jgi:hypothetical protein